MASIGLSMHESRRSSRDFFGPRILLPRIVCGGCGGAVKPALMRLGADGVPMCPQCLHPVGPAPGRSRKRRRSAKRARAS
ncbi:MAG: hypothetical protein KF819_40890 [Labilithrix sp.]|nr:hypothetical protein [Labilithrix sp.]